MRAITVIPGQQGSVAITDMTEPPAGDWPVLVETEGIAICGPDLEIINGDYGWAPPGQERLIIGHESLGQVAETAPGTGFAAGDLVVGVVRRPDPVPCPACAAGDWDMCRNDRFVERGIVRGHGYGRERWRGEPRLAVSLPRELGDLGVLLEPASVLAKAWDQIEQISNRGFFLGGRGLVCGAGPLGLLGFFSGVDT